MGLIPKNTGSGAFLLSPPPLHPKDENLRNEETENNSDNSKTAKSSTTNYKILPNESI